MSEGLTLQKVVEVAQETLARIWAKGSHDSEPDHIHQIVELCKKGRISMKDAISKIIGIEQSQQDYH